ncbi:signal peptidase I [Candidatus Enterococcus clewellii]|uniref:Signal peptidase I n=1 Tax=Candidatus Enterococcus clewellii TaxID=1834193 RepID=A0A242JYW3_9ENTE|nr:signal peptidase I [Enterococcus sp. 9E7_DIV0242]OTP09752.1 signal peptidase I [Enterococcus sp. 9E7_DIV0242]OTP10508.1 signal peptidase I [Enterococcus sp. 9E7_DIV0242]
MEQKNNRRKRKKGAGNRPYRKKRSTQKQASKEPQSWLINGLLVMFLAGILFFLFAFQKHTVDGVSMAPTLKDGDRIIIQRTQELQRYNLITFEPKDQPGKSFVKRVIGLPGDAIRVGENTLYLNGDQSFSPDTDDLPDGTLKVSIAYEVQYALTGLTEIPEDHYFVLGDNRIQSNDSRSFGLISKKQIEGIVVFRYFPFASIGLLR